MLEREFPGVEALRNQAKDFHVKNYDDLDNGGSFGIFPALPVSRANVENVIPVEGLAIDSTGLPVEFLLHIVDGYMSELEVVIYSDTKLSQPFKIEDIKMLTYREKIKLSEQ